MLNIYLNYNKLSFIINNWKKFSKIFVYRNILKNFLILKKQFENDYRKFS